MSFPTLPKTEKILKTEFWKTPIKYRAFNIGQQSSLLMAADSSTPLTEKMAQIKTVLSKCVDGPIEKFPMGLIEKLFISIREISIGEVLKISYQCQHQIEDPDVKGATKPCDARVVLQIKLDQFILKKEEGFKDLFDLAGEYKLKMRLPCIDDASIAEDLNGKDADHAAVMAHFVESLVSGDEVWEIGEDNRDEFASWMRENIEISVVDDIVDNFFNKVPHISYESKMTCPNCGHVHPIHYKGLSEVFI